MKAILLKNCRLDFVGTQTGIIFEVENWQWLDLKRRSLIRNAPTLPTSRKYYPFWFILVLFKQHLHTKSANFSGIQTQIVGVLMRACWPLDHHHHDHRHLKLKLLPDGQIGGLSSTQRSCLPSWERGRTLTRGSLSMSASSKSSGFQTRKFSIWKNLKLWMFYRSSRASGSMANTK